MLAFAIQILAILLFAGGLVYVVNKMNRDFEKREKQNNHNHKEA